MYINQIEPGSLIDLNVFVDGKKMEFNTEVVDISNEVSTEIMGIAVKAMYGDGKSIKFSEEYGYELFANIDQKPYRWTDIQIKLVKLRKSKEAVHLILSNQEGKPHNRRHSYRLWIGENATAQIGKNRKLAEVVVKDISATGISIVVSREISRSEKVQVGTPIRVEFEDQSTKTRFNVSAIVARIVESDSGRDMYGCQLRARSNVIERYVMQKQRDRINLDKDGD